MTKHAKNDLISENITIDNLDRVTEVVRYWDSIANGNRIGRGKTYYDDLGRVYKSEAYAVDPASGDVGNALASNTWCDAAGTTSSSFARSLLRAGTPAPTG